MKNLTYLASLHNLNTPIDSGEHNKPTVVFLHGVATTSIAWKHIIKDLEINKYRLITPDLLGFGLSPHPQDCHYSVDEHVSYIHQTLLLLKVRLPFILVGHSMGAIIATNYCRHYPEEVKTMILMSLPLYTKCEREKPAIQDIQTAFFLRIHKFLSENKMVAIKQSQFIHKFFRIDMEVNDENWDSFRLSVKNTVIKQNTYDDLKNIKHPIRIIYGNFDQFLVRSNIDDLSKQQNIEITRIAMVDHVISVRFAKKVAEILNALS